MVTPGISKNELKDLIKEVIISTLTERSDLLETAVSEAILDLKLGLAIEEGDTGEYSDEEHIISEEFQLDRVDLEVEAALSDGLARHDERAADVAVFDESFAVTHLEFIGETGCRGAGGIGNGNHRIDVNARSLDLICERFTHAQTCLVHGDIVDDGIWRCEIDPLERAGREFALFADAGVHVILRIDEDRLSGMQIADEFIPKRFHGGAFRTEDVLLLHPEFSLSEGEWPDPVRIAEREDALSADECHCGVASLATTVHRAYGAEDVFGLKLDRTLSLQRKSKNIEEDFGIG